MSKQKFGKSFFDDDRVEVQFWDHQPMPFNLANAEFSGVLFHKSSKTGFWVSRNYAIYDQKLIKIKNPNNALEIVSVELNLSRIEKIKYENKQEKDSQNKKKYGFRIIRNMLCKELYSRTKENCIAWLDAFKKHALQTQFKEDYCLDKLIGKGNFAKVFLATKKSNKQQFAIKAFEKHNLTNLDKLAILKEIAILRKINHKSIIQLFEAYEDDTHVFLVQEYLKGGELQQQIQKKVRVDEKKVAEIIVTMLESVDYLHGLNILHRDIKPENLILRSKGVLEDVVIADFGLADFYEPFGHYLFSRCGTPGFVAPEVLQDRQYDSKVDVFSIGCLMFNLLCGSSPFKGNNYDEIVMKNFQGKVDYSKLDGKASPQAVQLLKELLQYKPSQRISCREALHSEWFKIHLDKARIASLKLGVLTAPKNGDGKSMVSDGSTTIGGTLANIHEPPKTSKMQYLFSTPQVNGNTNRIVDKEPMTPQMLMMHQIQENINEEDKEFDFQELENLTDLLFDEVPSQASKLAQYQMTGKFKQTIDSCCSSLFATPIINCTPQLNQRKLDEMKYEQQFENAPVKPQLANKVMMSLKNMEK